MRAAVVQVIANQERWNNATHSGDAENHPMTRCMAAMGHLVHWVQITLYECFVLSCNAEMRGRYIS